MTETPKAGGNMTETLEPQWWLDRTGPGSSNVMAYTSFRPGGSEQIGRVWFEKYSYRNTADHYCVSEADAAEWLFRAWEKG